MSVTMPEPSSQPYAGTGFNAADSRDVFKNVLTNYGFSQDQITDLLGNVTKWSSTYTATQIVNDMLPTTTAYKQRFSANEKRVSAGLPALSPSTYIGLEDAYRQTARLAGLPKGFYDSQDSINNLIANDVSATEFNDRVNSAKKAVANTDPYYTQALQQLYGLDNAHMVAHMLDPNAAAPLIEKQSKAAEFGAAAARQGLQVGSDQAAQFEQYANGVPTGVGAEQGMQQVAYMTPTLSGLASISGTGYDQATAMSEVFGGSVDAQRKREQLINQEQNRFTGRSNVESKSLKASNEGLL